MRHLVLWTALAVYVAVVGLLVVPAPTAPSRAVDIVVAAGSAVGVTVGRTAGEFALNVVFFVPLSLIGGLLFPRRTIAEWLAAGFVVSSLIELTQLLLLPSRSGSTTDVVANTLGAGIGGAVAWVVCRTRGDRMAA